MIQKIKAYMLHQDEKSLEKEFRIRELEEEISGAKMQLNNLNESLKKAQQELQALNKSIKSTNEAEKQLLKSQKLLQQTEKIAHIGSWEYHIETQKLFWSDELFRICGFEPQSFTPNTELWLNIFHPEDREKATKAFLHSIKFGEDYDMEKRIIQKDGTTRYIHSQAIVFKNASGKNEKFIGTFHDITLQKEAEIKAANKKNLLEKLLKENKKILDSSLDVICTFDKDSKFVQVSAAAKVIWGYEPEELVGRNYIEFLFKEDVEATIQASEDIFLGKHITNFENRYVHKNGTVVSILWSARWDHKEQLMFCIARDATSKKEAEKILKLSEERYRHLFIKSPIPMWVYDFKSEEILEVNEAAVEKYGYCREEFLKLTNSKLRLNQETRQHIKKNREIIQVEVTSHKINYDGKDAVLLLAIDITKKIETEKELVKSTIKIHEILESITDGFFNVDKNWTVTFWNHEAEILLKVKKDGVLGQNLWDVFKPAKELRFYEEYSKAMNEKVSVHFDEYYPDLKMWFDVSAYPSDNGISVYFKDVTEQKRVQQLDQLAKSLYEKNAQQGSSLDEIINLYLTGIENIHKGMHCSLFIKYDNKFINYCSESFSERFKEGLNQVDLSAFLDNSEHTTHLKETVIVLDARESLIWPEYKDVVLSEGILSICSIPVKGANNEPKGIFVTYFKELKAPTPEEENTLENAVSLLSVILSSKFAELALRQSNERFDFATSATNDAIWDYDLVSGNIYWGKGYCKLFGYEDSNVYTPEQWAKLIHPDDKDRVLNSFMKIVNNSDNDYWREEYRYLKADNTYAYIIDAGNIIRGYDNKPSRIVGAMQDITERKKVEKELHNLSLIARETVNGVVVTNPDGEITWVNDGFIKICEYPLEEIIGQKPSFLQGRETDPQTVNYLSSKLKNKESFSCEIINYTKTGKKYWVSIQGQPIFDKKGEVESFFAIETDITRQKEEEQQLKLLESVITNANDAVIITQPVSTEENTCKIVYVNPSFTEMTGYSKKDVIGKSPYVLHGAKTDSKAIAKIKASCKKFQSCDVEYINYKKNGEEFFNHLSLIPIFDKNGLCTHWIYIQRDISNRKKEEEERELMIRELSRNNADLKQFSYITSHNIRAPLSNLLAIVNLLDPDSIPDAENRLLLEKFKESTVQLNNIINDLIGILVIKNNLDVYKEKLKLSSSFSEAFKTIENAFEEVGGVLETDFSQGDMTSFNPGYLHNIFLTLLSNAIKYRSPKRSLQLNVKTSIINKRLVIYFEDNGIGIDLNRYKDRMFGLYQRFHDHPDSKGMGLYIINTQIKAMGGEIAVESKVDAGTKFIITFSS